MNNADLIRTNGARADEIDRANLCIALPVGDDGHAGRVVKHDLGGRVVLKPVNVYLRGIKFTKPQSGPASVVINGLIAAAPIARHVIILAV
jgi:hypothetical protein